MVQNKGRVLPSEVGEQKALGEEAGRGGGGGGGGGSDRARVGRVANRAESRRANFAESRRNTRRSIKKTLIANRQLI